MIFKKIGQADKLGGRSSKPFRTCTIPAKVRSQQGSSAVVAGIEGAKSLLGNYCVLSRRFHFAPLGCHLIILSSAICHLSADATLQKSDLDSILVFWPHSGFLARDSTVPASPFVQRSVNRSKKTRCSCSDRFARRAVHSSFSKLVVVEYTYRPGRYGSCS